MAFFQFGEARDSFFADLRAQGRGALKFFINAAVCVERWF